MHDAEYFLLDRVDEERDRAADATPHTERQAIPVCFSTHHFGIFDLCDAIAALPGLHSHSIYERFTPHASEALMAWAALHSMSVQVREAGPTDGRFVLSVLQFASGSSVTVQSEVVS